MMMDVKGEEKLVWISTGHDVIETLNNQKSINYFESNSFFNGLEASLIQVKESQIENLSSFIHDKLHRCGGFMVHDSFIDGEKHLNYLANKLWDRQDLINKYSITKEEVVNNTLEEINETKITENIIYLSSFHTRFHRSNHGLNSQNWLISHWKKLTEHRNDVEIAVKSHRRSPQPSIILTIRGNKYPNQYVIIGGHADSISRGFGKSSLRSPGADDNASGIASITETLRVLMTTNFSPEKSIQFIAYAAEEVGLIGSSEIAKDYKRSNQNVVGVLQLDMSNYMGSDIDIHLINDFTNRDQNEFLGELIDKYVKVPWTYAKCGYACSDHASWTKNGYPASFPVESSMSEYNKKIHTSRDTIEVSGGHSYHAVKFSKLATAFAIELAK